MRLLILIIVCLLACVAISRQLFIIADPNTITLTATSTASLRVVAIRSWFEPDQTDPNRVVHHIVETLEM